MGVKNVSTPTPVMLSKRANVFYLEHARVVQQDERIVYLTQDGGAFEQMFNIPERNTAFLLLGKGTSITDAAMRRMAASNVMVGFCGTGGSPLFGVCDVVFMTPQSEYRPTEYMQAWAQAWFDPARRFALAQDFMVQRATITEQRWADNVQLRQLQIGIPQAQQQLFHSDVAKAENTQELLLAEARWAKKLYAMLAEGYGFPFVRQEGLRSSASVMDVCNGFLDHGNYIAYGYAAVVLCGLGISFAMPILHGKTRRGALVFDVADIIKDAYVLPLAFECAKTGQSQTSFQQKLIEVCQEADVLDFLFDFIKNMCKNYQ